MGYHGRKFLPHVAFKLQARFDEHVQINARLYTRLMEHIDGIFRGDVSLGADDERASTQPPERRIEDGYPLVDCRPDISQSQTARIVKMKGKRHGPCNFPAHASRAFQLALD